MPDTAPFTQVLKATIPAPSAANTAQDTVIAEAPFDCEVTEVTFISEGAVTANATNYRTLRVVNKGTDGSGSTVVASLALDTPTTDDLAAKDEKAIPLSSTAADLEVDQGSVLIFDETVASAGVAHTGGQVQVTISRGQD